VNGHEGDADKVDPVRAGVALCLSGGGYRAMLFHAGSLWRLNDAGLLPRLDRIASVSGGSIAAGVLAHRWGKLSFDSTGVAADFASVVVEPLRALASRTIDVPAILLGLLPFTSASRQIAASYRRHLFGDATLRDLPDRPRFVLHATNLQTGSLWRFSKPYMADWRIGEVREPAVELAFAVAASSAFPPFLSPARLALRPNAWTRLDGADLHREPFTTRVVLSDGGVYDNLGLETIEDYETVLVSDAGGPFAPQSSVARLWLGQMRRVLDVIDHQVRSLRKRRFFERMRARGTKGAYWGIRTDIAEYGEAAALDAPCEATVELADVHTRLAALPADMQERLIDWGYAVCDAALRCHVERDLARPRACPYPRGVSR